MYHTSRICTEQKYSQADLIMYHTVSMYTEQEITSPVQILKKLDRLVPFLENLILIYFHLRDKQVHPSFYSQVNCSGDSTVH